MIAFSEHLSAAGISRIPETSIEVEGCDPVLATRYPIGEAAATALAIGGATAAELLALRTGRFAGVTVDVGHAAATLIGFILQSAMGNEGGWDLVRQQPSTTGFFRCGDGRFIHLHGGFPHLHAGTLEVLGCDDSVESVERAAAGWSALDLEEALASHRLCGAAARSTGEWEAHPQGRVLRGQPVVRIERVGDSPPEALPESSVPLGGVRVLDLTRVLAGPAAGRTLAQYGADVLRVGSPALPSIPPFVTETGHGKRSAFVDLECAAGRERMQALAREADVVVDGYRPGSLERRGLGPEALALLRPGIVSVSICCYGQHGPWAERPGWEQLAQSATGIALIEGGEPGPKLLPAAATDYTTGYLAAYGAMEALRRRVTEGGSWRVEVSLCRTAMWLLDLGPRHDPAAAKGLPPVSSLQITSETPCGTLTHLGPAVRLSNVPVRWQQPTVPLGHHEAVWLPRD